MRRLSKLLRLLTMRAALEDLEGPRPALRRAPTPSEACELVNEAREWGRINAIRARSHDALERRARDASLVSPLDHPVMPRPPRR